MLRLAIITGDHQSPDPTKRDAQYNEEDALTHQAMVEAFESLERFDLRVFSDHATLFGGLENDPPDLVVNFCDTGIGNIPTRELHFPAWLELHDIPYTGATPQAMVTCFDKEVVRLVAEAMGIEVPQEAFIGHDAPVDRLPDIYPALLKPNRADGSVGITKDAVIRNESEGRAYLTYLRETLPGRDTLWQEYLPGPEYGIGLIGNPPDDLRAFPALEVDFSSLPDGLNPILCYESKAHPGSPHWTEIRFRQADIDDASVELMEGWARALFARFGLQDYGRFDFRVAADGRPKLLEVNPNPAWANDGKLAFMASFAGVAYPQMLEMVVDAALLRLARERA